MEKWQSPVCINIFCFVVHYYTIEIKCNSKLSVIIIFCYARENVSCRIPFLNCLFNLILVCTQIEDGMY